MNGRSTGACRDDSIKSSVVKNFPLCVVYNNYQLRTDLYSFDFDYGCMMMDGFHLWEPQKRHDFPVPLHHFSVRIGYNRVDLDQLIEYAMAEIPQQYSDYGEEIETRSEVYNRKGELFISSKFQPYIARSRNKPEPGDDIKYRDVRIAGHLEYDSGVLFARCQTLEFM